MSSLSSFLLSSLFNILQQAQQRHYHSSRKPSVKSKQPKVDSAVVDSSHSTASTEHRIWHVGEMLEAILHAFPIKDLLLSMRVCKTWKQAIDNSKKLQKDLYFLTDGELQPLLRRNVTRNPNIPGELPVHVQPNPLAKHFINTALAGKGSLEGNDGVPLSTAIFGLNPSWDRMLLTQPPISGLAVRLNYVLKGIHGRYQKLGHGHFEKAEHGARLGDLLELVKSQHGGGRWKVLSVIEETSHFWSIWLETEHHGEYERCGRPGELGWEMGTQPQAVVTVVYN